jgi:hypothetical protein
MNANMQVYALFNVSNPDRVSAALRAKFPDDHKLLGNNEWLISSAAATSREVCDSLGISDGSNGSGIIVAMNGYWGRATNDIWEWITAKKASPGG